LKQSERRLNESNDRSQQVGDSRQLAIRDAGTRYAASLRATTAVAFARSSSDEFSSAS
jgi:hypothetical protein